MLLTFLKRTTFEGSTIQISILNVQKKIFYLSYDKLKKLKKKNTSFLHQTNRYIPHSAENLKSPSNYKYMLFTIE